MNNGKYILPPHNVAPAEFHLALQNNHWSDLSPFLRITLQTLPLAAYIPVFRTTLLNRPGRRVSAATAYTAYPQANHLRIVGTHWPGLTQTSLQDFRPVRMHNMCDALRKARSRHSQSPYAGSTYNTLIWAVGRLWKILAKYPLELIDRNDLLRFLEVIHWESAPGSASSRANSRRLHGNQFHSRKPDAVISDPCSNTAITSNK